MIGNRALSWGLSALATGTLVALVTTAASGEAQVAQAPVRVGVIGTLFRDTPEPMMQVMLRPLKSLMETQTGLTGQLVAGGDVGNLAGQLVNKKVQLAVFHGFEFAWARLKFPALKPLMIAVNQQRNPKAMLIVHRNSLATGFGDLHGKDIALARFTREYCRLFLERRCETCGQCPEKLFGRITNPSDIDDALDDVVDDIVQATVVDSVSLASFEKRKPARFAKLKVIQESETFPASAVAYQPGAIDEATLKRFRDGMLNASHSSRGQQLLALVRMTGFEQVPDDYDDLLTSIAKAYPPPVPAAK